MWERFHMKEETWDCTLACSRSAGCKFRPERAAAAFTPPSRVSQLHPCEGKDVTIESRDMIVPANPTHCNYIDCCTNIYEHKLASLQSLHMHCDRSLVYAVLTQ